MPITGPKGSTRERCGASQAPARRLVAAMLLVVASACSAQVAVQPSGLPPPAPDEALRLEVSRIAESGTQTVAASVLREVYARAGVGLRVVVMPSTRASNELDAGRLDGEAARIASYFDDHPLLMRVGPPLMTVDAVVYTRAGADFPVEDARSLHGHRVGIVRGILQTRWAVAGVPDVLEVNSGPQMYRMLAAGRLDAIVDTPMNHRLHTTRLGLVDVVPRATLRTEPVYHGLHRRHAATAERVRATLRAMEDSGELAALVAKAEAAYLEGLLRP